MTREVQLITPGEIALIDDTDYDRVANYGIRWYLLKNKWHDYAIGYRDDWDKPVLMHRYITQCPERLQVDHVNRDGLDNRRCNLRIATSSQNQANKGMSSRNTTGYRGVHWSDSKKRYRAEYTLGGRKHHIGYFSDPADAARAYDAAAREAFGEFATTNF